MAVFDLVNLLKNLNNICEELNTSFYHKMKLTENIQKKVVKLQLLRNDKKE